MFVELSIDGGQTHTRDGVFLILREPDSFKVSELTLYTPVVPEFGYVDGGTLLKISYSNADAPTSPLAKCIFVRENPETGTTTQVSTAIVNVDSEN